MTDPKHSTLIRIGVGLHVSPEYAEVLERGDELHITVTDCENGGVIANGFHFVASETTRDIRKGETVVETQRIFTTKAPSE